MINNVDIAKEGRARVYVMHGDEAGELLRRTMEAVK